MANRLQDKTAIVTGADSGIGQAIADAFARESADAVLTYHTNHAGARTTEQAVRSAGRKPVLRQLDVRDQRAVAELFESALDGLGTPFILGNNAGVGSSGKQVAETLRGTG